MIDKTCGKENVPISVVELTRCGIPTTQGSRTPARISRGKRPHDGASFKDRRLPRPPRPRTSSVMCRSSDARPTPRSTNQGSRTPARISRAEGNVRCGFGTEYVHAQTGVALPYNLQNIVRTTAPATDAKDKLVLRMSVSRSIKHVSKKHSTCNRTSNTASLKGHKLFIVSSRTRRSCSQVSSTRSPRLR